MRKYQVITGIFAATIVLYCTSTNKPPTPTLATQSRKTEAPTIPNELQPHTPVVNASWVSIDKFVWRKGGFGSIMLVDLTIKNSNDVGVKDMTIYCNGYAPSGTAIDNNIRVIYQAIGPRSTKRFTDFNMGFINSQVSNEGCRILTVATSLDTPEDKPVVKHKQKVEETFEGCKALGLLYPCGNTDEHIKQWKVLSAKAEEAKEDATNAKEEEAKAKEGALSPEDKAFNAAHSPGGYQNQNKYQ